MSRVWDSTGSVLLPLGGKGSASGTPFLSLSVNSAVRGFSVWYVEQDPTALQPYPWSFSLCGDNAAVMDVELLGAWRGINATRSARHYIARVQGQVIDMGVFV
jgi:hypothetical protein